MRICLFTPTLDTGIHTTFEVQTEIITESEFDQRQNDLMADSEHPFFGELDEHIAYQDSTLAHLSRYREKHPVFSSSITAAKLAELNKAAQFDTYRVTLSNRNNTELTMTRDCLYHCYIQTECNRSLISDFNRITGDYERDTLPRYREDAFGLRARVNDMVPAVNRVIHPDGSLGLFVCYQPERAQVGDRFHYDHGAGATKNLDAEIIFIRHSVEG